MANRQATDGNDRQARADLARWIARLEQLDPTRITLGLDRVVEILDRLQLSARSLTISIAGTNGKGSCALLLDRLLSLAGRRVGRYTSPHLSHFNERVVVAGKPISDAQLVAAFEAVDRVRGAVDLSYFEFTTLAGLVTFEASDCDTQVLEIGLGGRLDAVNAVAPDACLLTNVGLDHQAWLGDDREAIGAEKAAIFRPDTPAVVASRRPPASVLETIAKRRAKPLLLGEHFDFSGERAWQWQGAGRCIERLPALSGVHQAENASGVLALLEAVGVLDALSEDQIRDTLRDTQMPGRLERIHRSHEWLLDVSHNIESVSALARWLGAQGDQLDNTLVFGAMRDKPIDEMLTVLAPQVSRWIAVAAPGRRALAASALAARMSAISGQPALQAGTPCAGARAARQLAESGSRIVVAGSFPVVGSVRAAL